MPRVYERKFDRDEMLRLLDEGLTQREVADRFGVHVNAVWQAKMRLDPERREQSNAYSREYMVRRKESGELGRCIDCGRATWGIYGGGGPRLRCRGCANKQRTKNVRPDSLRCSCCGVWDVDEAFSTTPSNVWRRGRNSECKVCDAARKRAWRAEHRDEYNARERLRKRKAA